jgi:hypothetical protein
VKVVGAVMTLIILTILIILIKEAIAAGAFDTSTQHDNQRDTSTQHDNQWNTMVDR